MMLILVIAMPRFTKTCTACKEDLPMEDFYNSKSLPDGRSYRCKACDKVSGVKYRESNKQTLAASRRKSNLKYRYGLDEVGIIGMLEDQNHCCKICGSSGFKIDKATKHNLVVDHCHDTGKVRGMLCHNCNRALGLFKDCTKSLEAAINYLKEIH